MTDLPEEETIRLRRARPGDTQPASFSETVAADTEPASLSETMPADTVPTSTEPDEDEPVRRRATFVGAPAEGEQTADGSTIVARRESRRRAAREHGAAASASAAVVAAPRTPPPAPADSDGHGRVASAPDAAHDVYGVRGAEPIVVPRTAAPEHAPQAPVDVAGAAARRRRTARRRAAIVVVAAGAVALAAAISLIALTFTP